jgi:two-component sensor histidine kinase
MALHELATNALRHGALADPNGQIELSWRIEGEMLHLHWREHLRAPLPPSNRNGFGTTVLRSMMARVLGAEVERIDHPSGLEWSFIIPLSRLDPDFSAPRPDQGDEIE